MEMARMPIVFRPARIDELQRAEELVVRSINDLTERHGFGPMATLRPPDFQLFSLQDDIDGLWVAEANEEIVGFALSWVCGDLWFLAELFVSPGHQGRGIGNELLARTFEHARKAGATTKASSPSRSMSCRRDCISDTVFFPGCRSIRSAPHVTR
jgi:ribosomal protein S18 acetylase RimI-like enzyme